MTKRKPTRRDTRRRVEQLANNPLCRANTLSAVHDVPMKDVAVSVGLTPKFGQSVHAITRGQSFENGLFRDAAARLRDSLVKARVLSAEEAGFLDLRIRLAGGPLRSLDDAHRETLALFDRIEREGAFESMPSIVAGPVLEVPGKAILPDGMVALDVLALVPEADRSVRAVIGEIKVYPDRGGHTDSAQLQTARAQAGLYLHLLRHTCAERGLTRLRPSDEGFLVLNLSGTNLPRVRAREELRFQAKRAEVAVQHLLEAASIEVGSSDAVRLDVIAEAGKCYQEGCVSFCDLADRCHDQALAQGEPAVLGAEAKRFLGSVTLHRATALLSGAAPDTDAEIDLVRRLEEAR
ncbi:MAG: hypothetical protein RLO52_34145 [Sandaracinaceae bacterium]